MLEEPIRVLLVEDNPGDATLLQKMLEDAGSNRFVVVQSERLDNAIKLMDEESFDIVVLDLILPDSQGLESVEKVRKQDEDNEVPIVVVTGMLRESEGLQALQHGAQDYLVKDNLQRNVLIRSIRYALERQRLLHAVEEERTKRRQANEMASLSQLSSSAATTITARAYGMVALREGASDAFEMLVDEYQDLIAASLEQRALKVDRRISQNLQVMAQRLGFLRAGPRDVVEIHAEAIKNVTRDSSPRKSYALTEEARFMLVEIMGCLTAYYRDHMVPGARAQRGRIQYGDDR